MISYCVTQAVLYKDTHNPTLMLGCQRRAGPEDILQMAGLVEIMKEMESELEQAKARVKGAEEDERRSAAA